MAEDRKVIAVLGATGAQGGGVVKYLLEDDVFAVRALTRNPSGEKGQKLAADGVDVVQANLDDVESLKKAFEGCYGAFFVTNYWEHMSPDREKQQIKNLAEAGRAAGLKHVVNSTLEDTRAFFNSVEEDRPKQLKGDSYVPHFDGKGSMRAYVSECVPTTHLYTSMYYQVFTDWGMGPKPQADGKLAVTFPVDDKPLPMVEVSEIGRLAAKIFQHRELVGEHVYVAGTIMTGEEIASTFSKVLGKPVLYRSVPRDTFAGFGFPGADDMANMFDYKKRSDFVKLRREDPIAHKFVPPYTTLERFIEANGRAFN